MMLMLCDSPSDYLKWVKKTETEKERQAVTQRLLAVLCAGIGRNSKSDSLGLRDDS